jgi:glycosyltransferase involved in cell wall biosynthesis
VKGILYSTVAVHRHAVEMGLALAETNRLAVWQGACLVPAEKKIAPVPAGLLARRRVRGFPRGSLRGRWLGQAGQILAGKMLGQRLWADRIWEWQEKGLARQAGRWLERGGYTGYVGLEHGALEALQAAKRLGVRTCLVFTSPHHAFRKKWVEDRSREHGIPISQEEEELLRRGVERDRRRDEEMRIADVVLTNSSLVSATLVAGGCDPGKVRAVPLGADPVLPRPLRKRKKGDPWRFLVSGPVSLRKGVPFLLRAWEKIRPTGATLDFYGGFLLEGGPGRWQTDGVTFHGNRPPHEVQEAYRNADVLIFPTLCDGFGMVVPEAMAAGCAVITTKNAGAADWVEEGKNGWVVEPGNAEALAEAIEKAMNAGERLEDMRARAQEMARQNSWSLFRKRFREVLQADGFPCKSHGC